MAITSRPSSAPLFGSFDDLYAEMVEDTGYDSTLRHRGANQFLGDQANHHDGQSVLGPNGNRVQDGALSRIHSTSPLGRPNRANPTGAQTS